MNQKIGFMQGRLSPLIGGKIQSFPWDNWECEFAIAESIDIKIGQIITIPSHCPSK